MMVYKLIKLKYQRHEITVADVWAYADKGVITEAQAIMICGPRER